MKKDLFDNTYIDLSVELERIGKEIPPSETVEKLRKDQQNQLRLFFVSFAKLVEQKEGFSVSIVAAMLAHMFFLGHEWTIRYEGHEKG